jgi:hypothetical protein
VARIATDFLSFIIALDCNKSHQSSKTIADTIRILTFQEQAFLPPSGFGCQGLKSLLQLIPPTLTGTCSLFQSQSQSYLTTDGQSVSLSWYQAAI